MSPALTTIARKAARAPALAYATAASHPMTEPETNEPRHDDLMPIEMAGSRTRLAWRLRERRNGRIAVLALLAVGALVLWAVYRFVNS